MPDKYQLTGTTNESGYFQIEAIADFGDVLTGDLGGFIESTDNLSQTGTCWVYDNAQVYGAAVVQDSAKVSEFASVYGDSVISGNARILGSARVASANVSGNAIVRGHAVLTSSAEVTDNAQVLDNAYMYGGSVSDNAIIQENARVFSSAQVYGNAKISDNAILSGTCTVYGNARVFANAKVTGNASVYGTAKVAGDATLSDNCSVFDNANVGGQAIVDGWTVVNGDTRLNRNSYVWTAESIPDYEGEVRALLATGGDVWNFDEDYPPSTFVGLFNSRVLTPAELGFIEDPSPLLGKAYLGNTTAGRIAMGANDGAAFPEYFNGTDFTLAGFYKITGSGGHNFIYGGTYNYTVSYVYQNAADEFTTYVYNNNGDQFTGSCDIPASAATTWTPFWIKRNGSRYQMYFGGDTQIDITVTGSVDFSADANAHPEYKSIDLIDLGNSGTLAIDQVILLPSATFTTDVLSWWFNEGNGRVLTP